MVSLVNSLANLLCYTAIIRLQNEQVVVSNVAKGSCLFCCPIEENTDITYILYTRDEREKGIILPQQNPGSVLLSKPSRNRIVIYIHGFSEMAPGVSGKAIKDAYLDVQDINVILVDWRKLSAIPWYREAVANTKIVGRNVARFLQKLDASGVSIKTVHVIGFSLGAVVASFAGKSMPVDKTIPHITGLDPAFPLYTVAGPSKRLYSEDATFVEVIHTDGGIFGHPQPMGDVDFYPNGGLPLQPGCKPHQLARTHPTTPAKYVTCSHQRAWRYYVESIRNPQGFPATRCQHWSGSEPMCEFSTDNYMGAGVLFGEKGRFYLETNSEPPFAKTINKH